MSAGHVTRRTIAFPGQSASAVVKTVGTIVGAATPGFGPFAQTAFDAKTTPSLAPPAIGLQSQRIDLPPRAMTEGPVTAICIAPDSAIHSCDIELAGKGGELHRHRVSPGNPLVGIEGDIDFALVSLPNMPPAIAITQAVTHVDLLWDSSLIALPTVGTVGGWPLRLEIWRGDTVPLRQHWRAPYFARGLFLLQDAGSGQGSDDGSFYVCVDGRRKVDVTVFCADATDKNDFTVSLYSVEPLYNRGTNHNVDNFISIPLVLDIAGNTSQTITSVAPALFSFDGVPMTLLRVDVAIAALAGEQRSIVGINVRAYD